jgi:hypothetical protein
MKDSRTDIRSSQIFRQVNIRKMKLLATMRTD